MVENLLKDIDNTKESLPQNHGEGMEKIEKDFLSISPIRSSTDSNIEELDRLSAEINKLLEIYEDRIEQ